MKTLFKCLVITVVLFLAGLAVPYSFQNPVLGATANDYNPQSFWAYPWGTSVTHKGVDIFKKKGTTVRPASGVELVVFAGHLPGKGGNVVISLAPKWRLHYYAHLDEVSARSLSVVTHSSRLGSVGNTGNAANTPSHLHFSIGSLLLDPSRMDDSPHGARKAFYLNPIKYLDDYHDKERMRAQ